MLFVIAVGIVVFGDSAACSCAVVAIVVVAGVTTPDQKVLFLPLVGRRGGHLIRVRLKTKQWYGLLRFAFFIDLFRGFFWKNKIK